ncbi:MAG: PadR family transcriptional regulator [Candidatus Aminicenantes bacterium]|nr:PadR family transcriptional regulator [Candidatus Aminicenantes bacterium]
MKELTKIEEILLWAIAELEDDAYGFRIRRHVSAKLGLDYTYGNLYSALGRLDQKGYVFKRTADATPARRGKARVYYTLSEDGRRALREAYELNRAMWTVFGKRLSEFGRS